LAQWLGVFSDLKGTPKYTRMEESVKLLHETKRRQAEAKAKADAKAEAEEKMRLWLQSDKNYYRAKPVP